MKIRLESYFLHDLIELLEKKLSQDYRVHRDRGMLAMSTPHYASRGRALDFSHGMGHFYLDMQLEEDLDLLFDIEQYHPLRFLYCLAGEFSHSGLSGRLQHRIKAGQGIAYACTRGQEQQIRFPAGHPVKCIGVQIIRHDFIRHRDVSRLPPEIRAIVKDTHANEPYLLHQAYSNAIALCLMDTVMNEQSGFAGDLLFEAKALEILGHQIEAYTESHEPF